MNTVCNLRINMKTISENSIETEEKRDKFFLLEIFIMH